MQLEKQSVQIGDSIMYPSYGAFLADVLSVDDKSRRKASRRTGDTEWSGTATYEDAVRLAVNGWEAGTEKVADLVSEITAKVLGKIVEQTMYLDTTTQYCWDMASAVAGVPQCGVNFAPDQEKKLVRIVVDFGASSFIGGNVLLVKAATIASLVASLEYAQFDTEVIVATNSGDKYSTRTIQCGMLLKSPGMAMDLSVMAYALGHPAFRRRIHFHWMEQFYSLRAYDEWLSSKGKENYGVGNWLVGLTGDINIARDYEGLDGWTKPEVAVAWIMEQLKAQGVQLAD